MSYFFTNFSIILQFCRTGKAETIKCGGIRPYCNETKGEDKKAVGDAHCTSLKPVKADGKPCESLSSDFDCSGQVGFLPDPLNCRRYFNCYADPKDAGKIKSEAFECSEMYMFDPSNPDNPCLLTNFNMQYCIRAECKDGDYGLQIMKYPTLTASAGQIGVQCLGTAVNKPLVYRCKGYATLKFEKPDDFAPICQLTCNNNVGFKAPVPKNPTQYYECTKKTATLVEAELKTCPAPKNFDADLLKCV